MDETRRLLRYVMPGVLFAFETGLFMWIVVPDWFTLVWKSRVSEASVGAVLGAVVVSGSLGFVFATAHHWLHWHSFTDKGILDYSAKLIELGQFGLLEPQGSMTRSDAIDKMSIEWWQRFATGTVIGNATQRAESLSDLAHAAGTARVASACAVCATVAGCSIVGRIEWSAGAVARFSIMLLIGLSITYLFQETYRRIGGMVQRFHEAILEVALRQEKSRQDQGCA